MDCLDLQQLRRNCRPNVTQFDAVETSVLQESVIQISLCLVNARKVAENLNEHGYISRNVFNNIRRFLFKATTDEQATRRIMSYLSNKISFVSFLWALVTSGNQELANLFLNILERKRNDRVPNTISKLSVYRRRSLYVFVKRLKFISDSTLLGDPVQFIRRLAIRCQSKFNAQTHDAKRKAADAYFATLAVELDNFSFLKNKFVGLKALQSEMKRVIPFTSNPAINEALVNGRIAETIAAEGKLATAKELMQDAMSVMVQTEACAENANIVLLQMNVLLHDYELNPTYEKKKHFIQTGENGLRMMSSAGDEFITDLKTYITQRMLYCALDLGITGKRLPLFQSTYFLHISGYFLTEMERQSRQLGPRRTMCYKLALSRYMQLTDRPTEAMACLKEAKCIAQKCYYVEYQSIENFEMELSLNTLKLTS